MRPSQMNGRVAAIILLSSLHAYPQTSLFYDGTPYSAGPTPSAIHSCDLNNDGKADLVVVSSDANVWILLGNGDGTFKPATPIAIGVMLDDVEVGDVNGDGKVDLVVASHMAGVTFVLLGNGDGTFQKPIKLETPGAGVLALGDLDADGKLDLVVATYIPTPDGTAFVSSVNVYLGAGDGSFTKKATVLIPSPPHSRVVVADFNGDSVPDLAVNTDSGTLCLMLGKGGGDFQAPITMNVGRGGISADILAGDFNLDGKMDLIILQIDGLKIMLGHGDGTFRAPSHIRLGDEPFAVETADVDGDGVLDLVVYSGDLIVLPGRGDGTFGPLVKLHASLRAFPRSIAVADFNRDGRPDLAVAESFFNPDSGDVFVQLNGGPQPLVTNVTNGASFLRNPVSPGEIVSLFGYNLGPRELAGLQLSTAGLVDTTNSGVRVLFDETPAPLLAVSINQVNVVAPYEIAGKSDTMIRLQYNGYTSFPFPVQVIPTSPGVFTTDGSGKGQGAILNQDSSPNSPAHPAKKGSIISIFMTGEGQTSPPGVDGALAGQQLPQPLASVSQAGIGDVPADILYAGAAPGLVAGVMQVNVRIPTDAPSGKIVPITLQVGDRFIQAGVTVSVK